MLHLHDKAFFDLFVLWVYSIQFVMHYNNPYVHLLLSKCIFWWEATKLELYIPNAIWVAGVFVSFDNWSKKKEKWHYISYLSSLIHSSEKESKGIVNILWFVDSLISLRVVISIHFKNLFIKCDRKCIPE